MDSSDRALCKRCWGRNDCGQLGDGTTARRSTPPTGDVLTGVKAIAAGLSFALGSAGHDREFQWALDCLAPEQHGSDAGTPEPRRIVRLMYSDTVFSK
jgi:hypothetical protein